MYHMIRKCQKQFITSSNVNYNSILYLQQTRLNVLKSLPWRYS